MANIKLSYHFESIWSNNISLTNYINMSISIKHFLMSSVTNPQKNYFFHRFFFTLTDYISYYIIATRKKMLLPALQFSNGF